MTEVIKEQEKTEEEKTRRAKELRAKELRAKEAQAEETQERGTLEEILTPFMRPGAGVRGALTTATKQPYGPPDEQGRRLRVDPSIEEVKEGFIRGWNNPWETLYIQELVDKQNLEQYKDATERNLLGDNSVQPKSVQQMQAESLGATAIDEMLDPVAWATFFGGKIAREVIGDVGKGAKALFGSRQMTQLLDSVASMKKHLPASFRTIINKIRPDKFSDDAIETFNRSVKKLGENFDDALTKVETINPDVRFDISDDINKLVKAEGPLATELKGLLSNPDNDILKTLLKMPEMSKNLSLRAVQKIKTILRSARSARRYLEKGATSSMSDIVNNITRTQAKTLESLGPVFTSFRKSMDRVRAVKAMFRDKTFLNNVMKGDMFGNAKMRKMVFDSLPQHMKNDIVNYRNFEKLLRFVKKVGGRALEIGLAGGIVWKIFGDEE